MSSGAFATAVESVTALGAIMDHGAHSLLSLLLCVVALLTCVSYTFAFCPHQTTITVRYFQIIMTSLSDKNAAAGTDEDAASCVSSSSQQWLQSYEPLPYKLLEEEMSLFLGKQNKMNQQWHNEWLHYETITRLRVNNTRKQEKEYRVATISTPRAT
jgi:hypothetical protein